MKAGIALIATAVACGALAASAFGHAKLLDSQPGNGQTLERSPRAFVLTFDEPIDVEFVQLRVQDSSGARVTVGRPYHPGGREEVVAVRLRPRLEGTVVARYRVLSEDGHPVGRRTAFRVRAEGGGARREMDQLPAFMPEEGHTDVSGDVTDASFAFVRGLGYVAIALGIGGIAFLLLVWIPAVTRLAGGDRQARETSRRFVSRARRLVLVATAMGVVATALAIAMEAATAAGASLWAALNRETIEPVAETRVVQAWAARLVVWLLLGLVLFHMLRPQRAPVLRRTALGADGSVLAHPPSRSGVLLLVSGALLLAISAPLAGHSGGYSPRGLLVLVDTLHVLCMSTWLGGLVMLGLAVPLWRKPEGESTRLLAGVVGRFSRMAMIAVPLLAATGAVQAIALIGSVDALVDTGYGRLVLAKITLLIAIVALGALNQRRSLPRLRDLAGAGMEAGRAGVVLRRRVAAEVLLALVVIGVTSTLVATEPPAGGM